MAKVAFLSLLAAFLACPSAYAAAPYCLAGDECFPTAEALSQFNSTVEGRLLAPLPYASVCYKEHFDAAACNDLVDKQTGTDYRDKIPAALMFLNHESTGDNKGCPPPAAHVTAPVDGSCTLGNMASYVVKATSAKDVSRAVKFAAQNNLRLRIKNTGHDYAGRSTGAGAFTIWTHNLKSLEFNKAFVADGCKNDAQPAIVAGAGIQVQELFDAAKKFGVNAIGGYTPSVGAAGGYTIGGGLGPLSSKFGMGVDNVIQFETVTADGTVRIANECQNQDLFWALRGGGAAFGVNTRLWFKGHPAFQQVNVLNGTLVADSKDTFNKLVHQWLDFQATLRDNNYNGISEASYPGVTFVYTDLYDEGDKVKPATVMMDLFKKSIDTSKLKLVGVMTSEHATFSEAYDVSIGPTVEAGGKVGANLIDVSRVFSNDIMADADSRSAIADVVVGLPANAPIIIQLVAGGAVNKVGPKDTSVHPAWRTAHCFTNIPVFGGPTGVTAAQNATAASIAQSVDQILSKHGKPAAYYNEEGLVDSDGDINALQWGDNYPRLLSIKKQLDPQGVFSCRHCVGAEVTGI